MSKLIQQRGVLRSLALSMLCFTVSLPIAPLGYTDDMKTVALPAAPLPSDNVLTDIKTYLLNLGGDLGYSLEDSVTTPTSTLLDSASTGVPVPFLDSIARNTFASFFGAMPVSSSLPDPIVPSAYTAYNALNAYANATFVGYNPSPQGSALTNPGALSWSPLLDQLSSQQDPVSQYILNILSTPDSTYCMESDDKAWSNTCGLRYGNQLLSWVIGTLPLVPFLDPTAPQSILSELNSDSLTGPLLYATASTGSTTSSTAAANAPGLTATTQAQQAANFIRYASGAVVPLPMMRHKEYTNLYDVAVTINDPHTDIERTKQENALATLTTYLAQVRVYAAQHSVPISNLYYILSKRMPQTTGSPDKGANSTSQAMSEMTMATRRIYNPAAAVAAGSPQWLAQINTASPATVQKEMAILLSEINYQLYLNRQQDERLLLTNSLLLFNALQGGAPSTSGGR